MYYTYVYISSKRSISGWFEGKILYFNIQIRVYHILFTDRTTDYVAAEDFDGLHRPYFIAKIFLSLSILFIHCSFAFVYVEMVDITAKQTKVYQFLIAFINFIYSSERFDGQLM